MSAQPTATVIVCTYNRCQSLRNTLQSLAGQRLSPGRTLDVVVVDNNSTDQTKDVVAEAARHSPWTIRYVFEPRQGLGHARNAGLTAAQGAYIAITDDDVVATPGWVDALVRCFDATDADMVVGKIAPLWLTARPQWLADDLMAPIISLDWGASRKRCTTGRERFLGANCSVRRSSVAKFGMFDPSLGRRGNSLVGGEDFEMFQRWFARGAAIIYEPTAVMQHTVSPERVTEGFYRRWFRDIGYTQGHQQAWKWHYVVSVMPVWRWGRWIRSGARYLWVSASAADAAVKLHAELWWKFECGFFRERLDHWIGKRQCHFARAG